jgi:hypothetical protein
VSGYLRRVLSRSTAPAAPGSMQPSPPRRWTSAREPFGVGPALTVPVGLSTPLTRGESRAAPPPVTPPSPDLPAPSGLAADLDRPRGAPNVEPPRTVLPSPALRAADRHPMASGQHFPAEPVAVHSDPLIVAPSQPAGPSGRSADPDQPTVMVSAPLEVRSLPAQPSREPAPTRQSILHDDRPAVRAATQTREPAVTPRLSLQPAAPPARAKNPSPTPQPNIVIGRISVVVDAPRPVTPTAAPRPHRRATTASTALGGAPRFAHRFGIGQL